MAEQVVSEGRAGAGAMPRGGGSERRGRRGARRGRVGAAAAAFGAAGLLAAAASGAGGGAGTAAAAARGPASRGVPAALTSVHFGSPNAAAPGRAPLVGLRVRGTAQAESTNWAGYADDNSAGNTYTQVQATWVQPAVSCNPTGQELAAFWVGLDGFNDGTVEQDGSLAYCDNGVASYYDWWEMYPANAVQIVAPVSPGDTLSSFVVYSNGAYDLHVEDQTNPSASFTTTQRCSSTCSNSSAEWIAERPSTSTGLAVLPDFGKWSVIGARVRSGGVLGVIDSFPDVALTMVDTSGNILVGVSPLNSVGGHFVATWYRSS